MAGRHKEKKGHRYSYSGADAKVWMHRGNNLNECFVESLQTISFSVHEPRGRVRALGYKGVKGFTRSVREIAGTMIFTVIEDHPLAHLMKEGTGEFSFDTYSAGYGGHTDKMTMNGNERRLATTIKPFDLTMIYATEMPSSTSYGYRTKEINTVGDKSFDPKNPYEEEMAQEQLDSIFYGTRIDPTLQANYNRPVYQNNQVIDEFTMQGKLVSEKFRKFNVAGLSLKGIEIITEGIVTSVNDMITEIQVQFLAKDYKEIGLGHFETSTELDITYDEAYEFAKELYRTNADYQKYESDLEKFEKDMTVTRIYSGGAWGDPSQYYNAEGENLGYNTGINTAHGGRGLVTNAGFSFDEKTGTFTSTVVTVNNPALVIDGDE